MRVLSVHILPVWSTAALLSPKGHKERPGAALGLEKDDYKE